MSGCIRTRWAAPHHSKTAFLLYISPDCCHIANHTTTFIVTNARRPPRDEPDLGSPPGSSLESPRVSLFRTPFGTLGRAQIGITTRTQFGIPFRVTFGEPLLAIILGYIYGKHFGSPKGEPVLDPFGPSWPPVREGWVRERVRVRECAWLWVWQCEFLSGRPAAEQPFRSSNPNFPGGSLP
jgi:hypothetical protein